MTDAADDLIRRGDVLAIQMLGVTVTQIERAIRAIPKRNPLSDPRVVALVDAANDAKIILAEYEPHPLPILGRLLTALRAIGGEA